MGHIMRTHRGQLTAPTALLTDLDHVLVPNDGASAQELTDLFSRVDAARAAHRDPELDTDLVDEARELNQHWALELFGLHALHQLRATATINGDTSTLDASWVSHLRNNLSVTVSNWGSSCQEFLDELLEQNLGTDPMTVAVQTAVNAGTACGHCEHCQFLDLRDRLDAALDAAGYDGGVYYRTYIRGDAAAA